MTSATVVALPLRPALALGTGRFNAHLLNVTFESPDGERRSTLGGGESVPEAIAMARGELPLGVRWTLARWAPVFGE